MIDEKSASFTDSAEGVQVCAALKVPVSTTELSPCRVTVKLVAATAGTTASFSAVGAKPSWLILNRVATPGTLELDELITELLLELVAAILELVAAALELVATALELVAARLELLLAVDDVVAAELVAATLELVATALELTAAILELAAAELGFAGVEPPPPPPPPQAARTELRVIRLMVFASNWLGIGGASGIIRFE